MSCWSRDAEKFSSTRSPLLVPCPDPSFHANVAARARSGFELCPVNVNGHESSSILPYYTIDSIKPA